VVAQQLAMLAVVVLTNRYGTKGALADYNYAWAIYLLPWAILAVPIATSAFPVLSARAIPDSSSPTAPPRPARPDQPAPPTATADPADRQGRRPPTARAAPTDHPAGNRAAFDRITAATTRAVVLASAAGAALLIAIAFPAAHFFDAGPQARPEVLTRAVLAFAPGLLGYGLVAHTGRVLFACGRGRAAAVATVLGWAGVLVADVALALVVPADWLVAALGLGNSIGMTVAGVLLLAALFRARGRAPLAGLARATLAGLFAGAAGGLAGYGCAQALGTGGRLHSIGAAAVAAVLASAVFLLIAFLIDRRDLRALLGRRVTDDAEPRANERGRSDR
jgi:putative peptidoglycan lipid II flippase